MATGLRRGELLELRWSDIEGGVITVRQTLVKVGSKLILETPKTRKGTRMVAISPDVMDVLAQHRLLQQAEATALGAAWPSTLQIHRKLEDKLQLVTVKNDLVFTSEVGTPLNPDNLKRVRDALMDKAEVPRVRLHNLRHFTPL